MNISWRRILLRAMALVYLALGSSAVFEQNELKAQEPAVRGWKQGQGWGWIWGKQDEIGSLNAVTPAMVLKAVSLVKQGKVYDMGVTYDRTSFKWPGHSPGEILMFRTPEGVKRQKDLDFTLPGVNPAGLGWHSAALFISDNVATQIDGLGHITSGEDNHWYNGFKEADWGGNWGIRKADVTTIPPMVLRAVLVDVAGFKKVEALAGGTTITADDLKKTLEWEKVDIRPGDAVFIRTGTLRYWGATGSDHEKLRAPIHGGINLAAAGGGAEGCHSRQLGYLRSRWVRHRPGAAVSILFTVPTGRTGCPSAGSQPGRAGARQATSSITLRPRTRSKALWPVAMRPIAFGSREEHEGEAELEMRTSKCEGTANARGRISNPVVNSLQQLRNASNSCPEALDFGFLRARSLGHLALRNFASARQHGFRKSCLRSRECSLPTASLAG